MSYTIYKQFSIQVDILARKMWDIFDSDMNLNAFMENLMKDDKVYSRT